MPPLHCTIAFLYAHNYYNYWHTGAELPSDRGGGGGCTLESSLYRVTADEKIKEK